MLPEQSHRFSLFAKFRLNSFSFLCSFHTSLQNEKLTQKLAWTLRSGSENDQQWSWFSLPVVSRALPSLQVEQIENCTPLSTKVQHAFWNNERMWKLKFQIHSTLFVRFAGARLRNSLKWFLATVTEDCAVESKRLLDVVHDVFCHYFSTKSLVPTYGMILVLCKHYIRTFFVSNVTRQIMKYKHTTRWLRRYFSFVGFFAQLLTRIVCLGKCLGILLYLYNSGVIIMEG